MNSSRWRLVWQPLKNEPTMVIVDVFTDVPERPIDWYYLGRLVMTVDEFRQLQKDLPAEVLPTVVIGLMGGSAGMRQPFFQHLPEYIEAMMKWWDAAQEAQADLN